MHRRWLFLVPVLAVASAVASAAGATQTRLPPAQHAVIARIEAAWVAYRPEQAEAIADSALIAATAARDSAFVLQLVVRRGQMKAARGFGAESIPDLRRALTLAEARADTLYVCTAIRWLAVAEGTLGNTPEACELWERLYALAGRIRNRSLEATALGGRGHCAQLAGRSAEAAEWYREAADRFRELRDPAGEAFARNSLGTACQELGRYAEAEACYRRTAQLADSCGSLHFQAVAENNLGALTYFLGDPGAAGEHFRRSVALHDRFGNRRERLRASLNASICEVERGGTRPALAELESLLVAARAEQYRDLEGEVLSELAGVYRLEGRPAAAASALRSVLRSAETLPPKQVVESVLELSRCLLERDSLAAAVELLERRSPWAARLEDPYLRLTFSAELGRGLLRQGRAAEAYATLSSSERESAGSPYVMARLRLLAPLARAASALGREDEALRWAESAAVLWEDARRRPLDPEWREIQGAQAREISTVLAGLLMRADSAAAHPHPIERAYDQLQRFKARTLMERLLGPRRRADSLAAPPIRLAALQREFLRPGELLLDFYLGPQRSYLFLVDRDSARVAILPPEGILESAARDYCELIQSGAGDGPLPWGPADRRLLRDATASLRRRLLPAVEDLPSSYEHLFISPDGALNRLPFALLLAGAEDERSPRSFQTIPSASFLGRIRTEAAAREGGRGILAWSGRHAPGGRRLAGPDREIRQLDRLFGQVEHGDDIHPDSLPGRLERTALLHLAGHSVVDDQSPWLSSISLDRRGDSTSLCAAEIADLRLAARLVVLSSCTSAGGRVLSGEGVQGLTSAFLGAGVPAVVATLWPVDDRATAAGMERFYDGLARGENPGRALSAAQAALGSDPRFAHPFYWAGFVLVGDGEVRPALSVRALRPRGSAWLLGGAGGGAVVLVLVLTALRRRRRRSL